MSNNIALLIKNSDKFSFELHEHYLNVLGKDALVYNLLYNKLSTVTAKTAKAYLDILITKIPSHIDKLVIADSWKSLELVIDPKELTRLFCKLTSRVSMFDQSARFRQFQMNDDFVEKRQVGYNLSSFYFNSSFC